MIEKHSMYPTNAKRTRPMKKYDTEEEFRKRIFKAANHVNTSLLDENGNGFLQVSGGYDSGTYHMCDNKFPKYFIEFFWDRSKGGGQGGWGTDYYEATKEVYIQYLERLIQDCQNTIEEMNELIESHKQKIELERNGAE